MTTITGYSCLYKKKHIFTDGSDNFRYYCEKTGYEIDPLTCKNDCKYFESHTTQKLKK